MSRHRSIPVALSLFAAVLAAALMARAQVPTTGAVYRDSVGARVSAQATDGAVPQPPKVRITLIPGRSRARFPSDPCPSPRIARVLPDGGLELDYGELDRDTIMRSTEVFLVRNDSDVTLRLRCSLEGTSAPLFHSFCLSPAKLRPGGTATFSSVIEVNGAEPGIYEGFVRLKDASNGIDVRIPVQIVVLAHEECATSATRAVVASETVPAGTAPLEAEPAPATVSEAPAEQPEAIPQVAPEAQAPTQSADPASQ